MSDSLTPRTDALDQIQDAEQNYSRGPYKTLCQNLEIENSVLRSQRDSLVADAIKNEEIVKRIEEKLDRYIEGLKK